MTHIYKGNYGRPTLEDTRVLGSPPAAYLWSAALSTGSDLEEVLHKYGQYAGELRSGSPDRGCPHWEVDPEFGKVVRLTTPAGLSAPDYDNIATVALPFSSPLRDFTLTAWIKPEQTVTDAVLVWSETEGIATLVDFRIELANTTIGVAIRDFLLINGGAISATVPRPSVGQWLHLAVAIGNSPGLYGRRVEVYTNGVRQSAITSHDFNATITVPNGATLTWIGRTMSGLVSDTIIYPCRLNDSQVWSLFDPGSRRQLIDRQVHRLPYIIARTVPQLAPQTVSVSSPALVIVSAASLPDPTLGPVSVTPGVASVGVVVVAPTAVPDPVTVTPGVAVVSVTVTDPDWLQRVTPGDAAVSVSATSPAVVITGDATATPGSAVVSVTVTSPDVVTLVDATASQAVVSVTVTDPTAAVGPGVITVSVTVIDPIAEVGPLVRLVTSMSIRVVVIPPEVIRPNVAFDTNRCPIEAIEPIDDEPLIDDVLVPDIPPPINECPTAIEIVSPVSVGPPAVGIENIFNLTDITNITNNEEFVEIINNFIDEINNTYNTNIEHIEFYDTNIQNFFVYNFTLTTGGGGSLVTLGILRELAHKCDGAAVQLIFGASSGAGVTFSPGDIVTGNASTYSGVGFPGDLVAVAYNETVGIWYILGSGRAAVDMVGIDDIEPNDTGTAKIKALDIPHEVRTKKVGVTADEEFVGLWDQDTCSFFPEGGSATSFAQINQSQELYKANDATAKLYKTTDTGNATGAEITIEGDGVLGYWFAADRLAVTKTGDKWRPLGAGRYTIKGTASAVIEDGSTGTVNVSTGNGSADVQARAAFGKVEAVAVMLSWDDGAKEWNVTTAKCS